MRVGILVAFFFFFLNVCSVEMRGFNRLTMLDQFSNTASCNNVFGEHKRLEYNREISVLSYLLIRKF